MGVRIPRAENVAEMWDYPGGEIGVRARGDSPRIVRWDMHDPADLLSCALWLNALQANGYLMPDALYVPYLPYARQDRVAAPGDGLPLKLLGTMLERVQVYALDPHSVQAWAVSHAIDAFDHVHAYVSWLQSVGETVAAVVAPDHGAYYKVSGYADALQRPVVTMGKTRDPETGKLAGFHCENPDWLRENPGAPLLICDDICDGGGTFLGLLDVIRALDAESGAAVRRVHLWVTHGIFSKGHTPLLEAFASVGTTDSWPQPSKEHGGQYLRLFVSDADNYLDNSIPGGIQ